MCLYTTCAVGLHDCFDTDLGMINVCPLGDSIHGDPVLSLLCEILDVIVTWELALPQSNYRVALYNYTLVVFQ